MGDVLKRSMFSWVGTDQEQWPGMGNTLTQGVRYAVLMISEVVGSQMDGCDMRAQGKFKEGTSSSRHSFTLID